MDRKMIYAVIIGTIGGLFMSMDGIVVVFIIFIGISIVFTYSLGIYLIVAIIRDYLSGGKKHELEASSERSER